MDPTLGLQTELMGTANVAETGNYNSSWTSRWHAEARLMKWYSSLWSLTQRATKFPPQGLDSHLFPANPQDAKAQLQGQRLSSLPACYQGVAGRPAQLGTTQHLPTKDRATSRPGLRRLSPRRAGWGVGRSRDARPSPRAPHSSALSTPPAALAPSRPSGLGLTPASEQWAMGSKTQRGARLQPPWGPHRARGWRWHAVPAAVGDGSYRQQEAGRKEERAQAQPLHQAARTSAAAAAAAERAGREPGGTCAQAESPARPAPPRALARPAHWPGRPGGGSRVGGAAWRLSRQEPVPLPEPAWPLPTPDRSLPLSLHMGLLSLASRFLPGRPSRCPNRLARRPADPHFTRLTSKHPRPDRWPRDGSPVSGDQPHQPCLATNWALEDHDPSSPPFSVTLFSQSREWEGVKLSCRKKGPREANDLRSPSSPYCSRVLQALYPRMRLIQSVSTTSPLLFLWMVKNKGLWNLGIIDSNLDSTTH